MKLSKMKVMEMVEVKKIRSENLDVNMDVINLEELKNHQRLSSSHKKIRYGDCSYVRSTEYG